MAKKKSKKNAPAGSVATPSESAAPAAASAYTTPLVVVTLLTAALVAGAAFLPAVRLWGVNHIAFLSPTTRLVLLGLLGLAFVPAVAVQLYRSLLALGERGAGPRTAVRVGTVCAIAIASVVVFHTFRSATNLLGDGQLIVQSFEAADEGHDSVIMRSAHAIVTEETIAPGATLLYYAAIKALKPFGRIPVDSMRLLNCVLGGLFVLFTLLAASSRALSRDARVWLVILGLFSSSLLLFFGYIENYTAPYLFLLLYVIAAFRALHRQGSPWLALVPLACAIYSHVQCVLFVPSLVYLLLWTRAASRRRLLIDRWIPVFAALAFIGIVGATLYPPIRRFYVPLGFSNEKYALFSPDHLLDVVNEFMLLLPILPTILVMAWAGRRAERAAGQDAARSARAIKDPGEWFTHPAEWQLAGTILIPCVLYMLLFHPEIGMARDWDLFAMTTTAIVPLVLLTLNRYLRATGATPAATARFATPALAIVVVLGLSWVAVNASTERTIDRFQRILTYDQTHASYAWENLAIQQHDSGHLKEAIEMMQRAVAVSHNPRQIVRLAVYIEEDGRVEEALTMLEEVLEKRPAFSKARFRVILFLEKTNQWERMLPFARDGVKYNPSDAIYRFFYAECLLRAGQKEQALTIFRACQSLDLPPAAKEYIASVLAENPQP